MVLLYLAPNKTILIILIFSCYNIWAMKNDRIVEIPGEKTLAILTHAMTDEGTRMNLEKSATLSMLSLLPTRFPKGYLSSFPE